MLARLAWAAWRFYFSGAPRYPLETASIALAAIVPIVVLSASSERRAPSEVSANDDEVPPIALPLFVAAAFVAYAPALGLGLLSDDFVLRAAAQAGAAVTGPGGFFRPLTLLLWRTVLGVRDSPVLLHAVNLTLHGVNAWLVSMLAVRLGFRGDASIAAGGLFLTFPAAPEAVAWASGIQDVLMTSAALGAVVAAMDAAAIGGWLTAAGLFAASLATKETAIGVPVLIAISRPARTRARQTPNAIVIGLCVIVVGVYAACRASVGIRNGFLVEPSRFLVKHMAVTAFGSMAVPWRVPASAIESWRAFVTTVGAAAALGICAVTWHRSDARYLRAMTCALWVAVAVAPVYSYFYVNAQLEGARYLYLAECGWALLLIELVWTATSGGAGAHRVRWAIVAAMLAVSVVTLERELQVWRRAAALRDRVLFAARDIASDGHACQTPEFSGIPDSLDGAFVFRNGFREALSEISTARHGSANCRFEWIGDAFVPVR